MICRTQVHQGGPYYPGKLAARYIVAMSTKVEDGNPCAHEDTCYDNMAKQRSIGVLGDELLDASGKGYREINDRGP